MQRRFLLFLALLLAFTLVPTNASATAVSFKFAGPYAYASFERTDPNDACIFTYASVWGTDGRIKEGKGKPESISEVQVGIFRYNNCTQEVLVDAFGSTTLSAEAFVADSKLESATLNATVEVYDYITQDFFPVSTNLTWAGTGMIRKESSKYSSNYGRCKQHYNSKGSFRDAVATGTVSALGTNLASESSQYAQLADVQSGYTVINCE